MAILINVLIKHQVTTAIYSSMYTETLLSSASDA